MLDIKPEFVLEGDFYWTTSAVFPSWNGFQSRLGTYGSQDQAEPSDGKVRIVFAPQGRGIEPLSASEIASVFWVIENEALISEALISSLVKKYPVLQKQYGFSDDEEAKLMPDVKSADDFRSLIGLSSVNIHQVQKDGTPYAGFEFGCAWDDEHGLGVLMHGTRTVEIGGADTAILLWIAEEDARTQER
ncbi:hypothetical protein HDF16_002301 [Granulicella aggregans]|uniref:DUF6985 domain-containing protein n=1 Tax=Granulicella aggregans TaxID=474949 RepID=A0A7W7ZCV6_9BACT|nr:hypothetical protein [Granulicella aggregans]MBB5057595.1 hypothetical protein [Granulicella aggregans]